MKIAQKPRNGSQIEKWYPTTTSGWAVEFERLLKPIKGVVSGGTGGDFSGFAGGTENA